MSTVLDDADTIVGQVQRLRRELQPKPEKPGTAGVTVQSVTVVKISAAATATQMPAVLVKSAMIQNISVNPVTLGSSNSVTSGNGFILNAAAGTGNAGDTVTIAPQGSDLFIDLSLFWFVQTGAGNTLALLVLQ